MAISINNTTGNILCLTKVPNIIEYTPGTTTGSFTQIVITIADNTENTGQKVVIDGITVSTDNFLLTKSGKQSAMNLSNALNNTSLIAEWRIWFTGNSVYLKKRVSDNVVIDYSIDFPFTYQQGRNSNTLTDVQLNLFRNNEYCYTCSKKFYKDNVAFNISGILDSLTPFETIDTYNAILFNDKAEELGTLNFKAIQGYKVAKDYLEDINWLTINYNRLFTYYDYVPFSYYSDSNFVLNINYYINDKRVQQVTKEYQSGLINDIIYLTDSKYDYVDLEVNGKSLRYYKLKPVDYTSQVMRVYWYNCYGGISFFDFTSDYTESTDLNYDTYDKSIYDYYKGERERTAYYNKEVQYTITIKSHILSKNDTGIFDDLASSSKIWVERDNDRKYIIIKNQSVDRNDYNTYQASITFNYSING